MKKRNDLPQKIRYIYHLDPGAHLNPVHGVWGGINGQGEIEINFYTESEKFPEYSEQIVSPDGSLQHEMIPQTNVHYVVRNISNRLLLNAQTAQAFVEWLEEQLNELEMDVESDESAPVFNPGSNIKQ
ncbi:MAG: hypothetical protein K6G15_00575 [Desulfovibrio sp.]|nr:hypothetical protein [Desulfovibrio sp.]